MFGVKLSEESKCGTVESAGHESVSDVVRRGRLRWFGLVERKQSDDSV